MSLIPKHARCHGNRSREVFLKDPCEHLKCVFLQARNQSERDSLVVVLQQFYLPCGCESERFNSYSQTKVGCQDVTQFTTHHFT